MTHHITPEGDARPAHALTDKGRALGLDDTALLDHHIEELLGALGEPGLLRGDMSSEDDM